MAALKDIKCAKRILFIPQFLAMGDALFLSPVFKNIKDNVPGIKIYVLTSKYSMPVVKSIPYVDRVYCLDTLMGGRWSILRLLRLCLFFLRTRVDTIVLRGDARMPQRAIEVASKVCGLKKILIGPYFQSEVREDLHIVDTYLNILEIAGLQIAQRGKLYLEVTTPSVNEAMRFLSGKKIKKLIGIAPTSNMKVKNWTPPKTADLIRRLKGMSYEVLLFCADEAFAVEVRCLVKCEVEVIGLIDFRLLIGIVSLCKGFIGVDTGLIHLATALGVPTLGLYGPTSENVTGPYGPGNLALHSHRDCPYYRPTAPYAPNEKQQECYSEDGCMLPITNCVDRIDVEDVMESFSELMGDKKAL